MTDRLLTDEKLNKITEYFRIHNYVEEKDFAAVITDLHRYRDFCRRLVACYDGGGYVLTLVEEIRAAIEGKI